MVTSSLKMAIIVDTIKQNFNLQRHHLRERSLSVVNMFLDEMSKEAKNIITTICDEQCTMSDKVGYLIFS